MREILLLEKMPMILTKDKDAYRLGKYTSRQGLILILPEDAILVEAPDEP